MTKVFDENAAIDYCEEINSQWLCCGGSREGRIDYYHQSADSYADAHYRFSIYDGRTTYKYFQGSAHGHDYYLFVQGLRHAYKEGIEEGKRQALASIGEMMKKAVG